MSRTTRALPRVAAVGLAGGLLAASCSFADSGTSVVDPLPGAVEPRVAVEPGAVVILDGASGELEGGPDPGLAAGEAEPQASPIVPTSTIPQLTGWAAFDASLRDEILGDGSEAFSVAVSIGGEIVHQAAFGRRAPDTLEPAEATDRFRVASISKTITAISVMQLVEEGLVQLDQPVGEVVGAHVGLDAVSERAAAITTRQLLTHTSGFPQSQATFFSNRVWACPQAASAGLRGPIGGNGFDYSNMNYCVLGMLIEAVTGQRYEEVVYERLLTPLGISEMRMAPTYDPGPGEIEHVTTEGRNYMEALGAAGAWIASAADIVTILDSLDHSTPGWKPLTEPTVAMMRASATNPAVFDRGYGMGLLLYEGDAYGHTGTLESTHAMVLNRNDGVTWAVLVSGSSPSDSSSLRFMVDRAFFAGGFVFA